jgi:hypothetical protein
VRQKNIRYWILLLIIFTSCNNNLKNESIIYDDYLKSFYDAYALTKVQVPTIPDTIWSKNDTIIVDRKFSYMKLIDDDLKSFDINAYDTLIILDIKQGTFKLRFVANDSNTFEIPYDILVNNSPFTRYNQENKIKFYDQYEINRDKIIDSVLLKYDLELMEFYKILARENKRRNDLDNIVIY